MVSSRPGQHAHLDIQVTPELKNMRPPQPRPKQSRQELLIPASMAGRDTGITTPPQSPFPKSPSLLSNSLVAMEACISDDTTPDPSPTASSGGSSSSSSSDDARSTASSTSPPPSAASPSAPTRYEDRLRGAVHVLQTEAHALLTLSRLYQSDRICRDGFFRSVEAITRHRHHNGKVVFTGVGKSGWIARKLTATFTSLGIPAVFLHPTEALHGDLGIVAEFDTVLMITFSGKTPELMALLPHLNPSCPLICLTGPTTAEACPIARTRSGGGATILLPAPIPEPEAVSFGVSAPTTSTTMAIAVGDALAYVASREMFISVPAEFAKNHPGGAIGEAFRG